jgi:hypothetical protein
VEARYADNYDLSIEDLTWLSTAALNLRDLVDHACRNRIERLRRDAAG